MHLTCVSSSSNEGMDSTLDFFIRLTTWAWAILMYWEHLLWTNTDGCIMRPLGFYGAVWKWGGGEGGASPPLPLVYGAVWKWGEGLGGLVGWCIKEGSSVQYSIQCSVTLQPVIMETSSNNCENPSSTKAHGKIYLFLIGKPPHIKMDRMGKEGKIDRRIV